MEYVYAAMLLHKAGQPIEEVNLKKVLEAAGVKAEDSKIKTLVAALKGVDIEQAVKEAAPVAAAPAAKAEVKAEKPEEKKVSEDQAAAGLGALFG
ncbi:MAG: 50S ribosomal protein P1 [Candidatus Woesearchaeota archaeon]